MPQFAFFGLRRKLLQAAAASQAATAMSHPWRVLRVYVPAEITGGTPQTHHMVQLTFRVVTPSILTVTRLSFRWLSGALLVHPRFPRQWLLLQAQIHFT
jgi:hypothetical protein